MAEYFMSTVLLCVTCPGLSTDLIAQLALVEKTPLSSVRISYGLKCEACHLDVVARRYLACLSTFQPLFFMKTPRSYSSFLLRLSQEVTFAWYFRFLDDVTALHSRLSESFNSLLVWSNFPRRRITVLIRSLTLTIPITMFHITREEIVLFMYHRMWTAKSVKSARRETIVVLNLSEAFTTK